MYRTKIILVKNIFLEYCHFTCTYVRMNSCTYPIKKKYKGYFYQTMSINIPLFFQNNCECVSKHYKSSKLSSIYKMNHRNKQRKENELPRPQRAWANFENCNHLLPLPYSCFVYCLCTKLPSYS